jgi:uncharacterized protein (DUF362 family)
MFKRRTFLKAAVASISLSSCTSATPLLTKLPKPTDLQKLGKRKTPSVVNILKAESYDDNLLAILKQNIDQLNICDFKNKFVVLKPNMVECPAGRPVTTRPEIIKAVIELVNYLGAKEIVVAEGPGHMRDTESILAATGIGQVCRELGIQFIDLNLDDAVKVPIKDSFSGLREYFLPRTILKSDCIVSLPKMKTHHWVGVTSSMKNLFGVVPGRKYGYPKNILHFKGIPQCILDINRLVPTKLSVVDAITAMEGDGPINGTPIDTGIIIMGQDPAAIDAICARIMGFDLNELDYIKVAGEVIGNVELDEMKLLGLPLEEMKFQFKRPITYLKDRELSEKLLREQSQSGAS